MDVENHTAGLAKIRGQKLSRSGINVIRRGDGRRGDVIGRRVIWIRGILGGRNVNESNKQFTFDSSKCTWILFKMSHTRAVAKWMGFLTEETSKRGGRFWTVNLIHIRGEATMGLHEVTRGLREVNAAIVVFGDLKEFSG